MDAAAAPRKRLWDTILTTTPVILTVIGTLLAGVSSSEMTLSQYYRSLAGQNQSKAGDQWGFFQAKRIRGQGLESTLDLLPGLARFGPVNEATVTPAADGLLLHQQRAEKSAAQLQAAIAKAEESLGASAKSLRAAGDALPQDAKLLDAARAKLKTNLALPESTANFAYFCSKKMPAFEEVPQEGTQVTVLLEAMSQRKSDVELAPLVLAVTEEQIRRSLDVAETNAENFDRAARPVSRTIEGLDEAATNLARPAAAFHRAVLNVDLALLEVPDGNAKGLPEVRAAAEALLKNDASLRDAAVELTTLIKAARLDFNARRYRQEANLNQKVAALYEVQVRRHSISSDRHRNRSKQFFYGMLCAQAGVAIASLSLAARQKSVLWALAGAAGITALAFSLYVYLYQ